MKQKTMVTKKLRIPQVGDKLLFNLNGSIRPATVVTGGDETTTYVGVSVQAASDGGPDSLDKCSSIFYSYSPYGVGPGHWQWPDEVDLPNITVSLDENGAIVAGVPSDPTTTPTTSGEGAEVVPAVGLPLDGGSDLGKAIASHLLTIETAIRKTTEMMKNGRLSVAGSPEDITQLDTMLKAIGISCVEIKGRIFA